MDLESACTDKLLPPQVELPHHAARRLQARLFVGHLLACKHTASGGDPFIHSKNIFFSPPLILPDFLSCFKPLTKEYKEKRCISERAEKKVHKIAYVGISGLEQRIKEPSLTLALPLALSSNLHFIQETVKMAIEVKRYLRGIKMIILVVRSWRAVATLNLLQSSIRIHFKF
jgi:hypothetical protein